MARRAVLAALALLAVLMIAIAGAAAWVLHTEPGLRWSLARLSALAPGRLTFEQANGTWAAGWSATRIHYQSATLSLDASRARLALSPWSALRLAPRIDALEIDRLVLVLKAGDEPATAPPESLALPVRVDVASARVGELVVERSQERHVLRDVRASYAGGPDGHTLRHAHVAHEFATAEARGTLGAQPPFAIDGTVTATLHQPLAATAAARLGGSLEQLRVDGTVHDDAARVHVDALLAPFEPVPVREARVQAEGIDLHRYAEALPPTRISAAVALEARDGVWNGPLQVKNALNGPWDTNRLPLAALSAELTLSAEPVVARLDGIRADLAAAGHVSGSATVRPEAVTARLATSRLDLRGLYTKLRETALRGRVDLELTGVDQSASGALTQDDVELAFDAHRAGDAVALKRFVARSRGGALAGEAELSLSGRRPYSARATLSRFDPAAWGDFPSGTLNGRVQVEGALDGGAIRVAYALADSRLLGERLEGAGRFAYAAERISGADLRMALGGNRVHAQGDFGAPGDRLALAIDAPRLAALHAQVSGAVRGTATLTGTWRAPRVSIDAQGRRLAYGNDARVDRIEVQATLQSLAERALEVRATARGIQAWGWTGARASLAAHGTPEAHAVHAEASGGELDFELDARGSWQDERWTGVVSGLENRGALPFRLHAPVEVAAGPQSLHVGPFQATLFGGRMDVAGIDYVHGALRSEGRFTRLPLRPLLVLGGLPERAAGTLVLAGEWTFRTEPDLRAEFDIRRESGDVTVGRDRPLQLGLEALRIEGRLVEDQLRVTANVRSALVSGAGVASLGTLPGAGAGIAIGSRSPFTFSVNADIARLAALTGLFEQTTAYVDGRVHAALEGRGTLGDPVVTGSVTADRLMVALPPQGIELTDGTLLARITGQRIALERFAIRGGEGTLTARGTLSLAEGQQASVDWRADRLMILGRPDRRLIVTGAGNAALEGGKLAFTGKLRANEGVIQFGASDLPTLGSDVVVIGRQQKAEQAAAFENAHLRLAIDLGNDLHVLGHGLDAWLAGQVLLRTGAGGELLAEGTVTTQRGRYTAFGQRLQIDRGRLLFNGAVDNPGLDIVAMRKNQAVEAGVAVTGTVQSPVVRIVSDPPVPEGEALSWLVLGRGPADASRADLAMLPLAAAALFGQGTPGSGSFASKLGLDTLSVRGSTTLANNVVAVGKRFSRNLYVVYEQSLGGIANVLKVELNLTRRLLLRAEAGQVSAAGLVFRWSFD